MSLRPPIQAMAGVALGGLQRLPKDQRKDGGYAAARRWALLHPPPPPPGLPFYPCSASPGTPGAVPVLAYLCP